MLSSVIHQFDHNLLSGIAIKDFEINKSDTDSEYYFHRAGVSSQPDIWVAFFPPGRCTFTMAVTWVLNASYKKKGVNYIFKPVAIFYLSMEDVSATLEKPIRINRSTGKNSENYRYTYHYTHPISKCNLMVVCDAASPINFASINTITSIMIFH